MLRVREILSKEVNSVPYQSIYTNQQIGTDTPIVSYWKKYWPYRRNPAISADKCIPDRNKKKKKKKKKKKSSLSHLSTHRRHSQFLKLIAHGLSSLKFQIFLTGILFLSYKFTFSVLFRGGVQLKPSSLNFSFFKHPIKLTACKSYV